MVKLKIAYKLLIFIIILILLSSILFGSASYFIFEGNLIESRRLEAESFLDLASEELKNPLYFYGLGEIYKDLLYSSELGEIKSIIQNIKKNPNVESVYILSPDGKVITDGTSENEFYNQFLEDDFSKKSRQYDEELFEIKGDVLQISTPVVITEKIGTIRCDFSLKELNQVLTNLIITIATIGIVINGVVIVMGIIISRSISKPIIQLRDAAQKIGEGNLDTEIKIKSRDELGELASAFNQMTNDLKTSRAEIEKYSKELEKILKQKDEFIGQLGHDLKNPLTPIVGLLPIIMEQEKDPEIKEDLRVIVHHVKYMKNLVLKTLQLARLRSSNIKFDIQNINLLQVIKNVLESQQLLLKENNIKVENNVNDKIFVMADKLRVTELLNNLITNAVKYTSEGGSIITLDAKKDRGFVTVSIEDNGIGMTKEQLSHIFDEFYKADESRHDLDSSGLGLSICKRIVEKHGGRIWVESPGKGKGSTFYFTLKLGDEKIIKDI